MAELKTLVSCPVFSSPRAAFASATPFFWTRNAWESRSDGVGGTGAGEGLPGGWGRVGISGADGGAGGSGVPAPAFARSPARTEPPAGVWSPGIGGNAEMDGGVGGAGNGSSGDGPLPMPPATAGGVGGGVNEAGGKEETGGSFTPTG